MISGAMHAYNGITVKGMRYFFYCVPKDGKVIVTDYHGNDHNLKMYYRHERTWDDHMGNTPCGYYVNIRGERVYLY